MRLKARKKHIALLAALLAAIITALCPGCTRIEKAHTDLIAMDTVMDLTIYGPAELLPGAEELIRTLEKELSVTDGGSEIAVLNASGEAKLGENALGLVKAALEYGERTGGAFDICIFPVVRAWGFTTGEYRVPSKEELVSLLPLADSSRVHISGDTVSLDEGTMIDLGGIAKGRAADMLADYFRANGVKSAILNLGGNVLALGAKPNGADWRVGVADPFGSGNACIISCRDKAVVTSGSYQRYFEADGVTYCHIIDPSTGMPVNNGLSSVTVICSNGAEADALSTALFVMGYERASEFWRGSNDFEAVFIFSDGRIAVTEGLSESCSPDGAYADREMEIIKR